MIRVLWIDDQYADQSLVDFAQSIYDIEVIPFGLRVTGMAELEKNIDKYDAVILDANMLDASIDEKPNTDGLWESIFKLKELIGKKYFIPFVIYTAQPGLLSDEQFRSVTKGIDIYIKGKDNDRMLIEIKEKIKDLPNTKLKSKYSRAFDLCTNQYIGEECISTLMSLVSGVEDEVNIQNTEDKLNAIRKIVENIFDKFYRIGILPIEVAKGDGTINKSCNFLTGYHSLYKYNREILHPVISNQLKNILSVTQDGSHSKGTLILRVDEFIKQQGTPYLYNSTVFQLLDIMTWCKEFFDKNQDIVFNQTFYELISKDTPAIYEGTIEQDSGKNYFCGEYLLNSNTVNKNGNKPGDNIKIFESSKNNNKATNKMYPNYSPKFK